MSATRPRIVHVSTADTWRGGEQQLGYLSSELKKRIDQLVVCAPASPMAAWCETHGIQRVEIEERGGIDLSLARHLSRQARRFRAQLVHTHDAHAHTAAVLANSLFKMRVPLIVSRRVDFPIHSAFSKRFKYGHSSVSRIICVSRAIEAIMAHDLKDPSKLCTVHSGVDVDRFKAGPDGRLRRELGLEPTTKLVGNVAALAPHKDLFTFIMAAADLAKRRDDVHFVLIGAGELLSELRNFASAHGMAERLTFLGFRDDVASLLPELDVFLITSKTEGLGTSVLDAFAAGVPVVATAAGGIPEMVVPERTGLLEAVGDQVGLSRAVERLLDDPPLRERLVEGAREKLQGHTKEAMALRTLEVYQAVMQEIATAQRS